MGRAWTMAVSAAVCVAATPAIAAAGSPALLSSDGVAGVRFGLAQTRAVSELRRVFGRPSRRFVNSGCGSRFREVAWGDLYVEFREGRFTGFRYMSGPLLPAHATKRPARPVVRPALETAKGISLGSTLGRLRVAYGRLDLVGTDRWQTADGLVFSDDARRDPPPASSRIVEIKFGTCGDF